jgi:hypothetical protein
LFLYQKVASGDGGNTNLTQVVSSLSPFQEPITPNRLQAEAGLVYARCPYDPQSQRQAILQRWFLLYEDDENENWEPV